jgi:hypothetical protein
MLDEQLGKLIARMNIAAFRITALPFLPLMRLEMLGLVANCCGC